MTIENCWSVWYFCDVPAHLTAMGYSTFCFLHLVQLFRIWVMVQSVHFTFSTQEMHRTRRQNYTGESPKVYVIFRRRSRWNLFPNVIFSQWRPITILLLSVPAARGPVFRRYFLKEQVDQYEIWVRGISACDLIFHNILIKNFSVLPLTPNVKNSSMAQ